MILLAMLITGMLSIPLYRRGHLHYSILYYCPFFLAGFLLCDLYLARGEWHKRLSGTHSQSAYGRLSGSWVATWVTSRAFFDRRVISQHFSRLDFLGDLQLP